MRCHIGIEGSTPKCGAEPRGNDQTQITGRAAVSKRAYVINV